LDIPQLGIVDIIGTEDLFERLQVTVGANIHHRIGVGEIFFGIK
jgi:hypothetical protein